MILYTARWGSRAQAVVWAADRMDLFVNDGAAASAAMQQAEIPEATPTSPAAGANPSTPISSPAVPAAPNPPAAGTAADTADTMPVLEYKGAVAVLRQDAGDLALPGGPIDGHRRFGEEAANPDDGDECLCRRV